MKERNDILDSPLHQKFPCKFICVVQSVPIIFLIVEPIKNFDCFIVLWNIDTLLLLICSLLVSDGLLDPTFCQGNHEIAGKFLREVPFVDSLNFFTNTGIFDWDKEPDINLGLCSFTNKERSVEDDWF